MLNTKVLVDAGHWLYCNEYIGQLLILGGPVLTMEKALETGTVLEDHRYLSFMYDYEARLAGRWGMDVDWIFNIMEIDEADYHVALYTLLLDCRLKLKRFEENYGRNLEIYKRKMQRPLDTRPIATTLWEVVDLAIEHICPPDNGFTVYEGDRLVRNHFFTRQAALKYVDGSGMPWQIVPYTKATSKV